MRWQEGKRAVKKRVWADGDRVRGCEGKRGLERSSPKKEMVEVHG